MASDVLPPFINSTGLISKIFAKIQEAQEPERYTQDFQGTVLGYGSGSAKPFIPFLKRLGFLENDGRPTDVYRIFRNSDSAGSAMADAIRRGYSELFKRNEYCYKLSQEKLKNLVVEVTGKAKDSGSVRAICASFKACNDLADFESSSTGAVEVEASPTQSSSASEEKVPIPHDNMQFPEIPSDVKMSFGYTINLN
ncbi:MAG: DUF5343 domain-containing protein [Pseudomonadota bacterium]